MKKSRNNYKLLIHTLQVATEAYLQNDISSCADQLKKTTVLISKYVKDSKNIARTAFEIENICLQHDSSVNFSISIGNNVNNIDSRIQGCKSALLDLKQLQEEPKEFYTDNRITFKTIDQNANTAYTKEVINSLKYLGNRKNTMNLASLSESTFQFYEIRQEVLKTGKTMFLEEKQKNHNLFKESKNKGFERQPSNFIR